MALFTSDRRNVLQRLRRHAWESEEELQELLEKLSTLELRLGDIVWMLTDSEATLRHYGAQLVVHGHYPGAGETILREALAARGGARALLLGVLPRLRDPALPGVLDAWMRGKDDERAAVAVEAVLLFPLSEIGAQLAYLLRHPNAELRARALRKLLADIGEGELTPRHRQLLWGLAQDPEEAIRIRALKALARAPNPEFVDLLIARLRLETGVVRQVIARLLLDLVQREDLGVEDRLVPLLSEGDEAVRDVVIQLVQHMRDPARVVQKIILYSKTLMGWMRERIHQTIRRVGEPLVDPIVELLYHEDPAIRSSALMFASSFESPRMVDAVIRLLGDEDWWTRVVAIDTLGRLRDERAVEPLVSCLADEELRWSAIEALARIGSRKALQPVARLLSDPVPEVRIEVLRALEVFDDPRVAPLIKKVAEADPDDNVRQRAQAVYRRIAQRHRLGEDSAAVEARGPAARPQRKLDLFLAETRRVGGSDFHLRAGSPPYIRIQGRIARVGERVMQPRDVEAMLAEILTPQQREALQHEGQVDFRYDVPSGGRYRCNAFRHRGGTSAVFRVIPDEIPSFEDLRLPAQLSRVAHLHQGLVLVCGPAGSGKTTTLAALVNLLNETRHGHILTVERPVEYVHPYKNCLVNQREVGLHTGDFAKALRAALRQDPDVVVVGTIPDLETMLLTLGAAETGHLVIATMNATGAVKAVSRIVESFPPGQRGHVRAMLAEGLRIVLGQNLIAKAKGRGRVAVFELLFVTPAISSLIRESKFHLIPSLMQMGRSLGMCTVDHSLQELVEAGLITGEAAWMRAENKELFEQYVSTHFLEGTYGHG